LLGRILLRDGRLEAAASQFKKVPVDNVPPNAAYEVGVTMFQTKSWKRAAGALAKVPRNGKYANFAALYRGLSYAHLQEWDRAITWLSRAKKLPSNLEASRREA